MPKTNSDRNLLKSFQAAFRGIFISIRDERNIRIHFFTALLVILAGFLFKISSTNWIIILILFSIVIAAEMINTAIEKLADFVEPNLSKQIRDIKDIAAAAVLWVSIVSVIVGFLIFAPQIIKIFKIF
ncbi:MAG: diacylglycerol kinase family protein [Lentimicrobium sp.]|nr:diacylglycerol kinase family protein [Lentimicrobium sp.]